MELKDVKKCLGKKVLWKGKEYTLNAYTLRFVATKNRKNSQKGELYHDLELQDPEANATYVVDIENVSRKETQ